MTGTEQNQSNEPSVVANCDLHGQYIARVFHSFIDPSGPEMQSGCPTCDKERRERQKEELRQEDRRFHVSLIRGQANIPPRFRDCSFENYIATAPPQQHALITARSFAENFQKAREGGNSLTFCGTCGTGKTHLGVAVMNYLLENQQRALYTTVHEMIRAIRETWRRDSDKSETGVVQRYREAHLLVLDEVGASLGGEAEQNQLFDVLDGRYRDLRPMLIISNLSNNGLRQCLGDRIFDRLTEIGSAVVTFNWKSERQTGKGRQTKAL